MTDLSSNKQTLSEIHVYVYIKHYEKYLVRFKLFNTTDVEKTLKIYVLCKVCFM